MWRHLLDYPIIKKAVFAHEQLGKIGQKCILHRNDQKKRPHLFLSISFAKNMNLYLKKRAQQTHRNRSSQRKDLTAETLRFVITHGDLIKFHGKIVLTLPGQAIFWWEGVRFENFDGGFYSKDHLWCCNGIKMLLKKTRPDPAGGRKFFCWFVAFEQFLFTKLFRHF